ncbi:MAG: response regulator [Anaerolineales bacterium]|nr:MAG: response regulator [Anaerolineales bacterium]
MPANNALVGSVNQDRPSSILLVDDEPFNLDLLEQELAGQGFDIRTAADGSEALARVAEHVPDMIFLDLMMPVMDGFGVLEQLQAHEDWREIPVVIISASSDLENIVRGIDLGAADFLPKPFEPAILQARLNAGLEKKRLRDLEQRYLKSLERELEIGREIQAGFLPKLIPQPEGWHIAAHFQAAREVAGDFYDVFAAGPGKLGVMLGDVTDKGVGAALYMALYRSLLRATMLADTFAEDPEDSLCAAPVECLLRSVRLVNHYICKYHESAMFATLFFGILDTGSGELCYVNAGHDPPYLLRGDTIQGQIQPTGPMVGAILEAKYEVGSLTLESGDSLVLYSDGIPDAQDAAGEMLGAERFRTLLQQPAQAPSERFAAVLAALDRHLEAASQFDDITLVMVSRD